MISHYDGEKLLTFANSTNEETRNGVVLSFKFPLVIINENKLYNCVSSINFFNKN
jgi:hypothetical protein